MRRAPVPKGNPAGVKARAEIVAKKEVALKKFRRMATLALLVVMAACIVIAAESAGSRDASVQNFAAGAVIAGLVSLVAFFGVILSDSTIHLSREEYRSLPGALDDQGEHRCVSCGHRGIYRRTIYRTSTMLAACSKCEAPLWAGTND